LAQIGVKAHMRTIDPAQYQKRMDQFDYDVTVNLVAESLSPGNEQRDFWSSKSADITGGRNLSGIKDPVIDDLVEKVVAAKSREDLVNTTRALDRVLQWGFYYIPQWNAPFDRLAYWSKYAHPQVMPKYGLTFDTWWYDPQKAASLTQKISAAQPSTGQTAAAPSNDQAGSAPAPQNTQQPAAPAPATPPEDRGSSPLPYIIGGIIVAVVAFALGKRGRSKK
ncbi:MAG TPA: hypothetical protein VGM59_13570, partial [Dongiaceae bacterium]